MKNSKKLNKETKNLIKAVVSVLIFFLLAIGVDAAGSQWYLWAARKGIARNEEKKKQTCAFKAFPSILKNDERGLQPTCNIPKALGRRRKV